jgi:uncharacterized tellurite resistance protein B-like protein
LVNYRGRREGGRSLHIIQKLLEVSKEALSRVVSCAQVAGYETANEITRRLEGKGLVP